MYEFKYLDISLISSKPCELTLHKNPRVMKKGTLAQLYNDQQR